MSSNSSSPSPTVPVIFLCQYKVFSVVLNTLYTLFNIFSSPLYVFILYTGFKRWRRRGSGPSETWTSHSDVFTFNMMMVELSGVLGSLVYSLSNILNSETGMLFGILVFSVTLPGQTVFHVLTCVDRYLAVVHPVDYLQLRETLGVRIRTLVTTCAWLLCFGFVWVTKIYDYNLSTSPFMSLLCSCTCVSVFCCVSVLHALTHPGPGPGDRNKSRNQADQSKQRALHIIIFITSVLMLRFSGLVLSFCFQNLVSVDLDLVCAFVNLGVWLVVPSSLVLPLLFLNKAGKLSRRRSSKAGKETRQV